MGSKRQCFTKYSTICLFASFSIIFDKVGNKLIGRKSLGFNGHKILGMGVMVASFHLSGKIQCSNEIFIMCVKIPDILGRSNFNTNMLISSTPQALDEMDLTVFITSSSVTAVNANLCIQGRVLLYNSVI